MFAFLISLFLLFITCILYFTKKDGRISHYLKRIKGPPNYPVVGTALSYFRPDYELIPFILENHGKYGPIFQSWLGNQPFVSIAGPDFVEVVLSSTSLTEKGKDYSLVHPWLGSGLLTAKPNVWHKRRKLLTPTFHFKILEDFIPIFNEQGNILVNVIGKREKEGEEFNIMPYITRCALDIICESAMGKKVNAQSGTDNDYVKAVLEYPHILLKRFLRPWLRIGIVWILLGYQAKEEDFLKRLHSFTDKVIVEKKERRIREINVNQNEKDGTGTKNRKAFLDLLLDLAEDGSLSDLDIRNETDTFMFEGHDTTSASMAWTIFLLAINKEHQVKVQAELDEIFGDSGSDQKITISHLAEMKYLECCIKETLRLYPSVLFFLRNATEDIKLSESLLIPKGTSVGINAYCLHRNPDIFPSPETFDPSRFFPSNTVGRHPFAYIPFSAGPRNCIGQKFALLEEKVVLAKLLLKYSFETSYSREDVKMVPDIILRPLNGIFVKITKRVKETFGS